MVFRNSFPQLAAIDGDIARSGYAQPHPFSLDLDDGDFDVCPEDDPLPNFAVRAPESITSSKKRRSTITTRLFLFDSKLRIGPGRMVGAELAPVR
jgi:hypothetical protein